MSFDLFQNADRKRKRNPAWLVQANRDRRGINIYTRPGAPAIAVNDGKIIRVGRTERLGRFVQLQDVYGNTYTYGHLKKVAKLIRVPHTSMHMVTQNGRTFLNRG